MSETTTTSIDLILAIGSLWKIVASIVFLIAIIIFREPLKKSITGLKNLRIKRGQTEVAVNQIAEKIPWTGEGPLAWQAFNLAASADEYLSDDPAWETLIESFTNMLNVYTSPAGAMVYARTYGESDNSWQFIGQSPLDSIRLPKGFSQIKTHSPYTNGKGYQFGWHFYQMCYKNGWTLDIYEEFLTRIVVDGKEIWKRAPVASTG